MFLNNKSEELNDHVVGVVLKELVRRALFTIRNERHSFEVQTKMGHDGVMDDVMTSADTKAQEVYLRSIRECFPGVGVVGEEDSLSIEGKDLGTYITIDPLDGTKAFIRRQSQGVGTMIAFVVDKEVVSAYIGDVNTQEIYGFRPGSEKVHRITEFSTSEVINVPTDKPLKDGHAMLRDPERKYSPFLRSTVEKNFGGVIVDGGSIGIWLSRLWKGEVVAAFMGPSWETPWDLSPIYGISKKLGYVFLKPGDNGWEEYTPMLSREKYNREDEVLIIHKNYVKDLS